jgi:hypothetical protein
MAALIESRGVRRRWFSSVGLMAVWLAVNRAASCVAWCVAAWRVPLPPGRTTSGEATGAWAEQFNHFYHTFFPVYVAACIFFLWLVGLALRRWAKQWLSTLSQRFRGT